MKKLFRFFAYSLFILSLSLPLMANKGCSDAIEEAEENQEEDVLPAGSETEEEGEIVPGTKLLESGGPEIKSAPPPPVK